MNDASAFGVVVVEIYKTQESIYCHFSACSAAALDKNQVFQDYFLVEMTDLFPNVTFGDCCRGATSMLSLLVLVLLFKVFHGSQRSAEYQCN